jgi:hypothetical protein
MGQVKKALSYVKEDLMVLCPEGPGKRSVKPGSIPSARAKLRLSRGFSRGLAQQHHPHKFSLGLFDHFTAPEQGVDFFTARIFCLTMPMDAQIVVDSNE